MIDAVLCWYDETPHRLAAWVAAAARFADHVVAVDGAYRLYPDAQPRSPQNQQDAILDAAASAGVSVTLHAPDDPWAGEVEKRNHSLSLCQGEWAVVADADMHLTRCEPGLFRDTLAATSMHVATYGLAEDGETSPNRSIYRHPTHIRYVDAHWRVRNREGWLRGGPAGDDLPAARLVESLTFEHRRASRQPGRVAAADAYAELRDITGAEAVPALA